jgi:sulfur-carrier protein
MIRVELPYHLRMLGKITGDVELEVDDPVTLGSVLAALESCYPMLRGTIRDHVTGVRRPMIRFYACEQDLSNEPSESRLPPAVVSGAQPLLIIGAIAGG